MYILNMRGIVLIASAVLLAACGRQERLEAVGFAKVLTAKQANLAAADAIERDLVANAHAWCAGIAASGSGRGEQLDQNAAVATELAKSAVAASAQLSEIRQAIDALALHDEYPRGVRNSLVTQLTRRQRMLQDIRALLESSATEFQQNRRNKSYTGDTYPEGISKLDEIVCAYKPPDPVVATAIASLQSKYNLRQNEM